jgi:hypothetical protein
MVIDCRNLLAGRIWPISSAKGIPVVPILGQFLVWRWGTVCNCIDARPGATSISRAILEVYL